MAKIFAAQVFLGLLLSGSGGSAAASPSAQIASGADCARFRALLDEIAPAATCVDSSDLTTANPNTTPEDNSRPDLPKGAFTPRRDNADGVPEPGLNSDKVPGLQMAGGLPGEPQARWVLRVPATWNGRLVVAVADAVSSEFTHDRRWSDFLVQRGYAYAATNKGTYSFYFTDAAHDPHACRISPQSSVYVHFYIHDMPNAMATWLSATVETARVAKRLLALLTGRKPAFTYLVGVSAGAWVVRLAMERAAQEFDGGLDWEGVNFQLAGPNPAIGFPFALRQFAILNGDASQRERAAAELIKAGFPADVLSDNGDSPRSLWITSARLAWERLACAVVFAVDPEYKGETADYDYRSRLPRLKSEPRVKSMATDASINRPLLSIQGTMDTVLPMGDNGRSFRAALKAHGSGNMHRLYEVQNGNHYDSWSRLPFGFSVLEPIQPHAHQAFTLLVDWVERKKEPPPGQCIPRGGEIVPDPAKDHRPEHCPELLVR